LSFFTNEVTGVEAATCSFAYRGGHSNSKISNGRPLLEPDVTEAQFGVIAELPADDQAVIVHAIDLMAGVAAASAPGCTGLPDKPFGRC